jgi:TPR repeat protein
MGGEFVFGLGRVWLLGASGEFDLFWRGWQFSDLSDVDDGCDNLQNDQKKGWGVTQDHDEAVKWYRRAADQGDANPQVNLGVMYDNGEGVTQDYAEALKWYRKAAEQGNATGQYNLGVMYHDGKGVAQDLIQAHKWFSLSAAGSKGQGQEKAAALRDAIATKLTPEQIAESLRLANEWEQKRRLLKLEDTKNH